MRSLSGRFIVAIAVVGVLFSMVAAGIGLVGIAGVRSATAAGNDVAHDELTTATVTSRLGRNVDFAYANGRYFVLNNDPAQRAILADDLYQQYLPAVDSTMSDLADLHEQAGDTGDELADLEALLDEWKTLRTALSPTALAAGSADEDSLTAAFTPLSKHIDDLVAREEQDAVAAQLSATEASKRSIWGIALTVAFILLATGIVGWFAGRRVRRALEPAQEQVEFADTLQLADNEDEAHRLLKRHLERSVQRASVTVLNRNNSADRLEIMTPVPEGSPLISSLQHAEPRSCLAIRAGRTHTENESHPALLGCSVCAPLLGTSLCTPLTVGGAIIGSVLANRTTRYTRVEEHSLRDSVSQAAPVLANLRNLAIAEVRAATDSLTGLPNKRAVADTLNRMLAQASRTLAPLSLLMLDLDHFKDINDRLGHPVGDQALASVGAALRSTLRDSDFAGRNGGEEFAIILPDTDTDGAALAAEKIRLAIESITTPGIDVFVTASIGLASYPYHATTPERLERLADSALYMAKRSGRNRVVVAAPTADSAAAAEAFPVGL